MKTVHKQVAVTVGDRTARVDAGIAPLIEQLWIAELDTVQSCENTELGDVWLLFRSMWSAVRFLKIVGRCGPDLRCLSERPCSLRPPASDGPADSNWYYDFQPLDMLLEREYDERTGEVVGRSEARQVGACYSGSIRFPTADYPRVLEHMIAFNRAPGGPGTIGHLVDEIAAVLQANRRRMRKRARNRRTLEAYQALEPE